MCLVNSYIEDLEAIAKEIRRLIIKTLSNAKAGHTGGSLSCVDILVGLYFHILKIDPKNPNLENRDRFILSKGHASAALYCTLAERGFFNHDILSTFDRIDSILQGHPDMRKTPGVDMSTGSLGQGLSVGLGISLGMKKLNKGCRTFVLLGDGEIQEGQIWEAIMYAGAKQIDNLIAIIDYNKLQLAGRTLEFINYEPLKEKFELFNWQVWECNGHSIKELISVLEDACKFKGKPKMIIAHTIKGKGVSFIEDKVEWHVRVPVGEEIEKALNELK